MECKITDLEYSAGLMSQSFWFVEFKKYLKLLQSGTLTEDMRRILVDENLFGLPNEYRAKRIYQYITKRASALDLAGVELFFSSDLQTQKLINLLCILRQDRLFFEFLDEVYREKVILGAGCLEQSDGKVFMRAKEAQSEEIAGWADTTKRKLLGCYFNFLTDCGLLTVVGKQKTLTPPLLDIAFEQYLLAHNEESIRKALMGVRS